MTQLSLVETAAKNILDLGANQYPGRGFVMGVDESGENVVQIYWLTGRGENSRNRVMSLDGDRVYAEAADPAQVEDPSLVFYNALLEYRNIHAGINAYIVTNGDQTDTIYEGLHKGRSFWESLYTRQYEPDAPNYTPRISCQYSRMDGQSKFSFSILRKSQAGEFCDRFFHYYDEILPGYGLCLTTYQGDGDPLPSFVGEPLLMPLIGDMDELATKYWLTLNFQNRISIVVKFINIKSGKSTVKIVNKYPKV
jgi:IMP cyclohydrolase